MNAVGIDVSKGKSTVAVLRPLGVTVEKPFEVSHSGTDLNDLAKRLRLLDGEVKVVMECTGRYYEPVAQTLHRLGFFVSTVNPLLIKEYGGNSLRRVKTDKADARKIAKYTLDNWAELREYIPMDTIRCELKTLNRQFQLADKTHTACVNNLIALLDSSFPCLRKCFTGKPRKDGSQKWVDFADTWWHVDCARKVSVNTFTERYRKWCKRHGYDFSADKSAELHATAREAVVLTPKDESTRLLVQTAILQVNAASKAAETYRAEMLRLASQLPEYPAVMRMYGCGESTGPQLMAEIGDICRFAGKQSLVAFAGVDPMPNQSGQMNVRSNPSSKRGSPYLRKTLFCVMDVLIRNSPQDEPVYQFLDRKRSEGKPYYVYMTAGANKFLRRYYAQVRDYLKELDASQPPAHRPIIDWRGDGITP